MGALSFTKIKSFAQHHTANKIQSKIQTQVDLTQKLGSLTTYFLPISNLSPTVDPPLPFHKYLSFRLY